MGMASSRTSPPGGGVVDMTSERDDAAEWAAIDLTGPERTASRATSAAGTLAAAANRSSTLLEEDSDCSSSDVLCASQDPRFANFTPTRRRNKPPRNSGSANSDAGGSTVAVIEGPPAGESPGGGASSAIDLSFDSELSATDQPVAMDSSPVVGRTGEEVPSDGLASSNNGGDSQAAGSGAAVAGGGSCREEETTTSASENGGGTGGSDVDSALAPEFSPDFSPELGPESGPARVPLSSSNGSEKDARSPPPSIGSRSPPPSIGSRSPPPSTGTPEGEELPDFSMRKPSGVSSKRAAEAVVNESSNPSISPLADAASSARAAGVSDASVGSAVAGGGGHAVKGTAGAAPSDSTLGVGNETGDEAINEPKELLAANASAHTAIDTTSGSLDDKAARVPGTLSKANLDSEVCVPKGRDGEAAVAAEHIAIPAESSELPEAALGAVASQSLISKGPAGGDAVVKVGDTTGIQALKSDPPDGARPTGNGAASTPKGMLCGRERETNLEVGGRDELGDAGGTGTVERAGEPRERGKSIDIAKPPATADTTPVNMGSRGTRSMGQEVGAVTLRGQLASEGASDSDKAVVSLSDARTMMGKTRASPLVVAAVAAAATAAAAREARVSCPATTHVGTGLSTVGSPVTTNHRPSPPVAAAVKLAAVAATTQEEGRSCGATKNIGKGPNTVEFPPTTKRVAATASKGKVPNAPGSVAALPSTQAVGRSCAATKNGAKGPNTVESPPTTKEAAATASEVKVPNAPGPVAAAPSAKQGQVSSVQKEASLNSPTRPTAKTGKTRNGPLDKPCYLYLQVIGPAPTQDKVPPAKMVKLGERYVKPVDLLTTLYKPGRYTLYVTASPRWNGGGMCEDPAEQPIEIKHFCIPDNLFPSEDARCIGCGEVLSYRPQRRIIKDPLGPGPVELRLIPRSGLSFLADLNVHVSVPLLREKGSKCSACWTTAAENYPTPAENYVALTNEDVSRALALKAIAHGMHPAMVKEHMVRDVSREQVARAAVLAGDPTAATADYTETPDEDAVAAATTESAKSWSCSIHDALGIQEHAAGAKNPTPASSIVAAKLDDGIAVASPPVPTTAGSTSGVSQGGVATTSATPVSAANTKTSTTESEAVEGSVRRGEGNPGETDTEQLSRVEAPTRPALGEREPAAREGPSNAATNADSVQAATSSSSEPMSLTAPEAPVVPGEEGTSFQGAQAPPGEGAVKAVDTPANGKVNESLSGFKRALALLDHAVKVGAGNNMGEAKRVLWPIADRLQDALTVARKSSSIEPKSWDELQRDYRVIREKLMGSSWRDGDALRRAAEIDSSEQSAGTGSGVVGSEDGGAKGLPRQPAQPVALSEPRARPSVSHSPSGVSHHAEGDTPRAAAKRPAIHDREAPPEAVATSPCTSQPSSGAAPQQQDDASRPGQQREHDARSPSSPHQQHAGQCSPPPQENGDQQASCLDRRVVVAPAPLPAAAGVTESVDNQHSPAGANADAVPTAAAAPPSKSHSSSAEKNDFEICPRCGGVGWVNNDRGSCHICLWSKGDVGSKQGACSPEATVTLAAVASGQGVDMAKKRDGSSKDGQTAAQACFPAKPTVVGVGPVQIVLPATAALSGKRSRDEAALDVSAAPLSSSAGLAAGTSGAEKPVSPSPTSVGSGKRSKIADCVSPSNGGVESASSVDTTADDKRVSRADSEVASLRHPASEAVAVTQAVLHRKEDKVVEAASVAPAEAEPPAAAPVSTAAAAAPVSTAAAAAPVSTAAAAAPVSTAAAAAPVATAAAAAPVATPAAATAAAEAEPPTAVPVATAAAAAPVSTAAASPPVSTAATATAAAVATAVSGKQAAATPAAVAARTIGSDSRDTMSADPSVCTGVQQSAASMAASDVTHAVATASSAMPSHADPRGHVAVTSTQASQLGHGRGMQNMWAHLPVSAATQHLARPTVVVAVAEATAAAHAYARAQGARFGGWASTHGAGQLACSSAGTSASPTSASFTGIPPRAPPACNMSAAVMAYPLAPFHHPGQEPAVPGTCIEPTSYEAQIRADLTPSMWGSGGGGMSSGSTFQAAQRPLVASGNDGRCSPTLPQQQHVDGAAAMRGDAASSTSANGERLEPSLTSSSEKTPPPPAVAATEPLPGPVVSQSTSAALPSATATAPAKMVPALPSVQPTRPPGRVLRGGERTPTPPGARGSSALSGAVIGGPAAAGGQSARVGTPSPIPPPRSAPESAVDTWPSSGKGAGAGGAALGTLVGGVLEKTGRESCVGGAGGGGAPAKGQPAVGREAVEGEEQKLERARVAKKLRREALLRRCITSAEHLHLEFRSVEAADAMDRGDDELSRLYLTEGDSIIPDNTRWGVRPRGQPLPYDCLFPDDKARGAVRQGTSAGGRKPARNKKRRKGSSGGSRGGGGRRSTAEQPEFTGEWRD